MRYKILGDSGLRVSELSLGTLTFGNNWDKFGHTWGSNKKDSLEIFDYYVEHGGNFIDTANKYTDGTSERYLSDFIKYDRDHFVLATKYTLHDKEDPNFLGNHKKNMFRSLEGSLKRLKVDYVDILYVHMWDFTTPIEEVMRALNELVNSRKVLHIGFSDTPAWIISQANTIASFRGWNKIIANTIEYSLVERTVEGELIPMSKNFNIPVIAWSPLGAGVLSGKYLNKGNVIGRLTKQDRHSKSKYDKIVSMVVDVAKDIRRHPVSVALNWLRQKGSNIIPVIGARTLTQLKENLQCLEYKLEKEHMDRLDDVSRPEMTFPNSFLKHMASYMPQIDLKH